MQIKSFMIIGNIKSNVPFFRYYLFLFFFLFIYFFKLLWPTRAHKPQNEAQCVRQNYLICKYINKDQDLMLKSGLISFHSQKN